VPIEWIELDDPDLRPDRWNIATVPERLASAGDPFSALLDVRQDLPTV
jgi:bifunctional non-homologous end joining protein LigD